MRKAPCARCGNATRCAFRRNTLPYFEEWKIETIHFDPRDTQG